jgi:ADP-ribosylglycohydrolase
MLGAIAGDIIGSVHEFRREKTMDFPLFAEDSRFTDDTVLTIAVAECLLTDASYVDKFHEYTREYPDRCYGLRFWRWAESGSREPYNSWGNGAAMRVSPVGCARPTLEEVLQEAKRSAEVTHDHPEGVRGRRRYPRLHRWRHRRAVLWRRSRGHRPALHGKTGRPPQGCGPALHPEIWGRDALTRPCS